MPGIELNGIKNITKDCETSFNFKSCKTIKKYKPEDNRLLSIPLSDKDNRKLLEWKSLPQNFIEGLVNLRDERNKKLQKLNSNVDKMSELIKLSETKLLQKKDFREIILANRASHLRNVESKPKSDSTISNAFEVKNVPENSHEKPSRISLGQDQSIELKNPLINTFRKEDHLDHCVYEVNKDMKESEDLENMNSGIAKMLMLNNRKSESHCSSNKLFSNLFQERNITDCEVDQIINDCGKEELVDFDLFHKSEFDNESLNINIKNNHSCSSTSSDDHKYKKNNGKSSPDIFSGEKKQEKENDSSISADKLIHEEFAFLGHFIARTDEKILPLINIAVKQLFTARQNKVVTTIEAFRICKENMPKEFLEINSKTEIARHYIKMKAYEELKEETPELAIDRRIIYHVVLRLMRDIYKFDDKPVLTGDGYDIFDTERNKRLILWGGNTAPNSLDLVTDIVIKQMRLKGYLTNPNAKRTKRNLTETYNLSYARNSVEKMFFLEEFNNDYRIALYNENLNDIIDIIEENWLDDFLNDI